MRVRASWKDVTAPTSYEAYTPVTSARTLDRNASGVLRYAWRRGAPAVTDEQLTEFVRKGEIRPDEAYPSIVDIDTSKPIKARSTSVQWNAFRKRWIMIAQEVDGPSSKLGEAWYLEADTPLGPWVYARKIITHDRYSFYEVIHHPALDSDGGCNVYFSGTYSDFLAGPRNLTPLYDYNVIMYRLDLSDSRLHMPVPVYQLKSSDGSPRLVLQDTIEIERAWDGVDGVPCFVRSGTASCNPPSLPNPSSMLFLERHAHASR